MTDIEKHRFCSNNAMNNTCIPRRNGYFLFCYIPTANKWPAEFPKRFVVSE